MKEEIGTGLVVSITVSYWVIGILLLYSLVPFDHQTEQAKVIWQTRYLLMLVIPLCASFAGIAGAISGGAIARLSHFRKKPIFLLLESVDYWHSPTAYLLPIQL